jgi:hypothetical protein
MPSPGKTGVATRRTLSHHAISCVAQRDAGAFIGKSARRRCTYFNQYFLGVLKMSLFNFGPGAALLRDSTPVRRQPTKPNPAPAMTTTRLCRHESSHAVCAFILGRPIVRLSIIPTGDTAGHTWNHRTGQANTDDLVILAAGYVGEEILMGDVNDHGSSDDVEKSRDIAKKLANGDVAHANTLLREAEAAARGVVQKYSSAILKLALRLQINKELVLDIAENEIRACIEAFEKKPALDAEWRRKIAYAQARQSVREYAEQRKAKPAPTAKVVRTYDCANAKDVAALLKRFPGLGDTDYSVRGVDKK